MPSLEPTATSLRALSPARHLANVAAEVAVQAARHVRSAMGSAEVAGLKASPTDVVTRTDIESERLIRRELARRSPGTSIVGEELPTASGGNDVEWLVDPIDGTVNFLYDLPVVAVSIAAARQGELVAGAVADVLRGDVFVAARHEGATLNGQPILADAQAPMSESLIGTGFSYNAATRLDQAAIINRVLPAARDIRCMGSAALNLAWVACGRLDGYYEQDTKPYDYAAASVIADEAGAIVELPDQNQSGLVIAARAGIFDELRALIGSPNRREAPNTTMEPSTTMKPNTRLSE